MQTSISSLDQYWRAANYITVANMYLSKVTYRIGKIESIVTQKHASGHWGTCPGLNFIYTHINGYIIRHGRKTQLVVGPGHGGNALWANLQIESIVADTPIRTESNPYFPGAIYDGGELGYSLPVAFGSVLDAPDRLCVCVVGDGEAETGTIAASWVLKKFMNRSSGFVLPILHLNGYRMGNRSLFSQMSDFEIVSFFKGHNYRPIVVRGDHEEMICAMDWVECTYREIEQNRHNEWPVLILKTPKGWTAPSTDDIRIENMQYSHKDPLGKLREEQVKDYLSIWLSSYRPEELFDINGAVNNAVRSVIPDETLRLGSALNRYMREKMLFPDCVQYCIPNAEQHMYRNVTILKNYLADIIRKNKRSFRIVSPDELESNQMGFLKTVFSSSSEDLCGDGGRVMEILNENICQAWLQGYIQTGRNGLMISYEAFMPIITSMVSQYAKWIAQSQRIVWREKNASMTYLLTSVCWANTFSHQNPEFINSMLSQQHSFVRIYTPPDANSLLASMNVCLASEEKINTVISTKQSMPQWFDYNEANKGVAQGIANYDRLSINPEQDPDVVLVAAGDYPMRECAEALQMIKKYCFGISIRFLVVMELTSIGSQTTYPHALNHENFKHMFSEGKPIVFCFHGYPTAIKMLLFDRVAHDKLFVLGYQNQSVTSTDDINKLILNQNSRYHVVKELGRFLKGNDKFMKQGYEVFENDIESAMKRRVQDQIW